MSGASIHLPVMLDEVLEQLRPVPGQIVVDGTLGGGGHARELARRVQPGGRVVAIDADPGAVARTVATLESLPVDGVAGSYADLATILAERGLPAVDSILLDLGLSSDQLADAARGFSYQSEGELDLRFNPEQGEPAWRLLARLPQDQLADIIYQYGEERFSRRIARRIIEHRDAAPIRTAAQLASLVRSCVPRSRGHHIDPATRTFQALRIAVNDELGALKRALATLPECLRPGGRLAIISFHSLEDRMVKQAYRADERLNVLTKRPIRPTDDETARNVRARSAKLRVAERNVEESGRHG